ncbi:hypothetical protein [Microbacterium sp.]|uniref:hypothetical protein n=1 Tax=Microbacterium sp. TaxID=51671 RepID=UPI0037C87746
MLGEGGMLRVGARADVVVSTVDPFAVPAEALISVGTAVTVVGGTVVHTRD